VRSPSYLEVLGSNLGLFWRIVLKCTENRNAGAVKFRCTFVPRRVTLIIHRQAESFSLAFLT
jgi:hypothetical protein